VSAPSEVERATGRFEIVNTRGLHARAATKLAQLASRYTCEVSLSGPDADDVNAKSVMGVLLLCGAKGTVVFVKAVGLGASEAVDEIGRLIAAKFGESE
jgi:phosphocarrier protein HPr